jgi:hypothetical protein
VNRVNQGPDNYASIIGSGSMYSDTSFPANSDMLTWSDYPGGGSYGLAGYASSTSYYRAKDKLG